jgi:hypothetical protein
MNVDIPESLFESLKLIIKYQNTLLLKEIAKEKGWKYSELKKEFLKDEEVEVLLKKYNNKQKKKKIVKKEEPPTDEEIKAVKEIDAVKEIEESNEIESEVTSVDKVNNPEKVKEPKKEEKEATKKKKKIKKVVNSVEIRCHKYIFDGEVFYVNVENNNAYDKNLEFVGSMLGKSINFNDDEKEN